MKEKGINRLIELLNQFEEEKRGREVGMKIYSDYYGVLSRKYRRDEDYGLCSKEEINYIFSREYGFIQRLVDNDKIDYNKDKYGMIFYENGNQKFLSSEDEVIMELSIQDNPIEFLISILKD